MDRKIDISIYGLYGLTNEEDIEIVEGRKNTPRPQADTPLDRGEKFRVQTWRMGNRINLGHR